ncbi:MAG: hypothetical protein LBJ35_03720 [Spirochaetaceae bacterium]|jgi:hypothetical protein|nr:hypothetical protein [Spirochaetaceae bacterium]
MRKLMLTLIALIAAVTFIRSLDVSLNAEEHPADFKAAAVTPDLQTQ